MGLDMYLYGEKFFKEWDEAETLIGNAVGELLNIPLRVDSVRFDLGYWKNAHHINTWIADNCTSESKENGEEITLTKEHIEALIEECEAELKALLPLEEDLYEATFVNTINIMNNALKCIEDYGFSIIYSSSW